MPDVYQVFARRWASNRKNRRVNQVQQNRLRAMVVEANAEALPFGPEDMDLDDL